MHNRSRAEERRLAADDGMSRLERQRQAVRLHRRTDMQSGMNIFTLTVDPVTGLRPEAVVVVDTTATDPTTGEPTVDWGLPVEIPHSVLLDLFHNADVRTVIVRNGVVLHAPGELNLGRSTRLANRAQRRALRALYSTCAIPSCAARFDLCKIHHVHWWRRGGRTDLANLLPICVKHHTAAHDGGWQLHLADDRTLTITHTDNTTMTTGPPRRKAA